MKPLSLRKQAQAAPKYILKLEGLFLYVAAQQGLTGCNLTNNKSEALQYSVGFDNEEIKKEVWTIAARKMMNNAAVKFEIIYL